ncbi:type VII secretion protein EssA [Pseudolactococcus reticulitermitis]
MQKMQKVLVSKIQRLLGRFFALKCSGIFILVIVSLFSLYVQADSNGSLKINTDILTNNHILSGGVGEFPIRGELFSTDLTKVSEQNREEEKSIIHQAERIDFSNQTKDISEDKQSKKLLFKDYQPQVITKNSQEDVQQTNMVFWFAVPLLFFLLLLGIFAGRWRVQYKRKKSRSENIR